MIYPEYYPSIEEDDPENNPEKIVFDVLKPLSTKYDIFYSQKFRASSTGERPDYEVDFIVLQPNKAILLIEVKGGLVSYDGFERQWYQNRKLMKKSPADQVISCVSSLLKRYPIIAKKVAVGWSLCFPQCELSDASEIPTMVNRNSIIDQFDLTNLPNVIDKIFKSIINEFGHKPGLKEHEYNWIKQQLLRGLGFVKRLSTRIELDEKVYIKLTNEQATTFRQAIDNKKIVVHGPAGSGKTILAKELAKEFIDKRKSVLLLCYNKVLSSVIRAEFKNYPRFDTDIMVSTFHHYARMQIDDDNWFQENKKKDEFWEYLIPEKLGDVPQDKLKKFDTIIVDEGQDFKEFWYDQLIRCHKKGGRFIVFLDENQDIFHHYNQLPTEHSFLKFKLTRNCRNSKSIIKFIEDRTKYKIDHYDDTPFGDCIIRQFRDTNDQVKILRNDIITLVENENIIPKQIVILIHTTKGKSCLANVTKIKNYKIKSVYSQNKIKDDDIQYGTIEIFKGLEADVVILADMHLMEENQFDNRLYVEASRAKHRLYVYERMKNRSGE